jgi:hypothetical protein
LDSEHIVVPFNDDKHWSFGLFCLKKKRAWLYDSLHAQTMPLSTTDMHKTSVWLARHPARHPCGVLSLRRASSARLSSSCSKHCVSLDVSRHLLLMSG